MIHGDFTGKVVAITGAAGGIGQELCAYFAAQGAAIAALDRSEAVERLADTLRHGGAKVDSAVVDVGDAPAVAVAFEKLTRALGAVDVLINNAGATLSPTLARTTPESFEEDVNANLNGAFNCVHAVVPTMKARRAGVIVNVGSVNGLSAFGDPAYSAAKAGMISLTRSLAMELGPYNIRANIVCPGTVRTPIWTERLKKRPELLKELERWYPLGRVVEPIEVTRAIAFLASGAASAITGVVLPVDCGLMAGNIVMTREVIVENL